MSTYPTELNNPPIVESITEIKFDSSLPNEAVFGVFYSLIKDSYKDIEQLNTANIPKPILDEHPELKFAPQYVLTSENKPLQIMIGPKVITFKYQKYKKDSEIEYPGWKNTIYGEIIKILSVITEQNFIQKVLRIGLRTIDFVEEDIFNNLKMNIQIEKRDLKNISKSFKFIINEDNFSNTISISNSSSLIRNNVPYLGSTIDIDTSIEEDITSDIQKYLEETIKIGHEINKKLFFESLTEEYITKLKGK